MNFENIFTWIILAYVVVINVMSIFATIIDKRKAKKNKWRIQESTLLFLAVLGGSLSMYITMFLVKHKTKKIKFLVGIPIIMVLQIMLFISIYILVT